MATHVADSSNPEVLAEILKELRNISSQLSQRNKTGDGMGSDKSQDPSTQTAASPISPNRNTEGAISDSSKPVNDKLGSWSSPLVKPNTEDEIEFWGDIDAKFFSEDLSLDRYKFVSSLNVTTYD